MRLQRMDATKPDLQVLDQMVEELEKMLNGDPNTSLSFNDLLMFQDSDGSFKLVDSYGIPSDARVDYCHRPTYIAAAILMREYLKGNQDILPQVEKALNASLHRKFSGHGYEGERGKIDALKIFIKAGLKDFLEAHRNVCPMFHQTVHQILHEYDSSLLRGKIRGTWGEDYREDWLEITEKLRLEKYLYAAYGSNMNKNQMMSRCPSATVFGKSYLEDWQLTFPHYANVEKLQGAKTPVLIWEITNTDVRRLDKYEGFPNCYQRVEDIVDIEGSIYSVMFYVMTNPYKRIDRETRKGYLEGIEEGYVDAGFSKTIR